AVRLIDGPSEDNAGGVGQGSAEDDGAVVEQFENGPVQPQGQVVGAVAGGGRVGQRPVGRAGEPQLGPEGVAVAPACPLGRGDNGEVGGAGGAGQVNVARAIHRDASARVVAAAAQVGGGDQNPASTEPRDEGVVRAPSLGSLEGVGGGKVRR